MRNPVGQGKPIILAEHMPAWQAVDTIFLHFSHSRPCFLPGPAVRAPTAHSCRPAWQAITFVLRFHFRSLFAHHGCQSPVHAESARNPVPSRGGINIGQYVKKYHLRIKAGV
jgi:hypothetical protein